MILLMAVANVLVDANRFGVREFTNEKIYLPLFVVPKFDVQWVLAVARFVNNSHLSASHDSYYLKMQKKYTQEKNQINKFKSQFESESKPKSKLIELS